MKNAILAVIFLSSAATIGAQSNLDEVVARSLKEFNVPGMAVGIIQNGKVVLAKGYGTRKVGESAPVTPHTLFQIASNTKAFTSASLAILADEKKLSWDDRVIDILPSFQMSDPYVSRELRVRDLLCHRSGLGLGAGDLMIFPNATLSTAEFMRRLRYVPLATSLRSRYAYDNVLYTVAGQVIEKVSGLPWAQFVRDRIFTPLGMAESRTGIDGLKPGDEVASPHSPNSGSLQVVKTDDLGPGAPAGSINASVNDMLKWVAAQLDLGSYRDGRLFSEAQSREMWTPHIFIPIPADYPQELQSIKPNFLAYALGWIVYDLHGHRIVYHTGGLAGMVTRVTLVPDAKLGIIVFTNQEAGGAFQSITQTILDQYLETPASDWVAIYSKLARKSSNDAKETVAKAASKRNASSKPSLPLSAYAGRYRDPWYGDILITQDGSGLGMQFTHSPTLVGKLEHFQYDTFIVRWNNRTLDADAYVTFALAPDARIRQVKMEAVSPSTDFSFDFQHLDLTPVAKDAKPQ